MNSEKVLMAIEEKRNWEERLGRLEGERSEILRKRHDVEKKVHELKVKISEHRRMIDLDVIGQNSNGSAPSVNIVR